ncbi:Uncharacterised protein g9739 [Pycnogonum litorale]
MDQLFDEMDEYVIESPTGKRKRRNPLNSSRQVKKNARYSGENKIPTLSCNHNSSNCKASTLSENDLNYVFNQLYAINCKVKQDSMILSYLNCSQVKRRRKKIADGNKQRNRGISIVYNVLTEDKRTVKICQSSFLSIFHLKKDRVQAVAKYWLDNGQCRPENRGGARITNNRTEKKNLIRNHIKTFICRASHYARRGTPGRKYLPSDLNVAKMHRMFKQQNDEEVTYSLYWSVFVYDFNLAFGHPSTDVCSMCVKYKMAVRSLELTDDEKKEKLLLYNLHRRKARQFYNLLNDVVDDTVTICFDIMENLVLPKSPIGQTYYSRQMYYYVFGVIRHYGQGKPQPKEDIHLYTWLEHQNAKDSNTVASALNHYFDSVILPILHGRKEPLIVRLFSDSCYGQNKNINVLSMLFALRAQHPLLKISYYFPVRGHSFLPADRAFGRIEQEIRKKETILLPDKYTEILQHHGTVHEYGADWRCKDYKAEAASMTKSTRSFKNNNEDTVSQDLIASDNDES